MKGKVLIVDDQEDLRGLLRLVLEREFDVAEAESGAALHKAFQQEQPDVVVLDVVLPDANGLELLPQIKRRWPDTEVLVLTGHGTFQMAVEATKLGAYNFISKPFENEKLLIDVRRAYEH
ncbi:MAG: response regulator, partial [Verrucomicrobiales bacterium]|nr:response regulator [Verrucomicrobiales bacterium]